MEWLAGDNPRDLLFQSTESLDKHPGYIERRQNEAKRRLLDLVWQIIFYIVSLNGIGVIYLVI